MLECRLQECDRKLQKESRPANIPQTQKMLGSQSSSNPESKDIEEVELEVVENDLLLDTCGSCGDMNLSSGDREMNQRVPCSICDESCRFHVGCAFPLVGERYGDLDGNYVCSQTCVKEADEQYPLQEE